MLRVAIAAVISVTVVVAQEAPAAQSKTAKEVDSLTEQAGNASSHGDNPGAIKLLESALAKAQRDPSLKADGRDAEIMRAMGQVYSRSKRYPEAVRAFTASTESLKTRCVPGKPLAEQCADTYYDLGTAQMYADDFAGAVVTLRKGIPLYEAMVHGNGRPDYKMAKLKLEANTQSMLAAALFRSGDLPGAISTWEKAIQQYQTVVNTPESGDGLQMLARQSMAQEQQSLKLVKEEANRRAAAQKAATQQKDTPKKAAPKK
jgi:tetratricopeptide (TPR) repeat protein